jgi:hypothetical protein
MDAGGRQEGKRRNDADYLTVRRRKVARRRCAFRHRRPGKIAAGGKICRAIAAKNRANDGEIALGTHLALWVSA